jgi:hypothetical protein
MRPVWYLSVAPDTAGLLLAEELPKGLYAPGVFFVERGGRRLDPRYWFLAVREERLVRTTLVEIEPREFVVEVPPIGEFRFSARRVHYLYARYLGDHDELIGHGQLLRLEPRNPQALEEACASHRFYFVGYGGTDDEVKFAAKHRSRES